MLRHSLRQQNVLKLNVNAKLWNSTVNIAEFKATNEPILDYGQNSTERVSLQQVLNTQYNSVVDVPIVIGDEEIRTSHVRYQVAPFDHKRQLARYYYADKSLIEKAIKSNVEARKKWDSKPLAERAAVLLRAADLVAKEKRSEILASTMLGQAKTVYQAEIDAACELIDFLRFNVQFSFELGKYKPLDSGAHTTNNLQHRSIEGFIAAVSPFNFTAIGGNLATAPALMGNTVLWKPSDTAILSSYTFYKILREAGLPAGVVNFVPSDGPVFGDAITKSPNLGGINFTGSVGTFKWLWRNVGQNLDLYKTYPRLVGECGGKNYHLVHTSADITSAAFATLRAAYEYSGQKCSACSRLYVPESKWPQMRDIMLEGMKEFKVGSPIDFQTFTSAVIDDKSFDRISNYIDYGKQSAKLLAGGKVDKSTGYYVQPTLFETTNPSDRLMKEEIFGPVLTVYVYKDNDYSNVLNLIDQTTPFALTGAIFAQDESVIKETFNSLKYSQGNFYINDKSTGAVVNQQPFGGARLSGTNDKAGGPHYLLKWTSPLSIKRYNLPITTYKHSSMV